MKNQVLPVLLIFLCNLVSSSSFAVDRKVVEGGLDLLYKNVKCEDRAFCFDQRNKETIVNNAIAFKQNFDQIVQDAPAPNVTFKKISYDAAEFQFNSLYVRPDNHPANKVYGEIYFPKSIGKCDQKFPATILVHKLGVDLESERQIAKMAAGSDKGIVMLIYLPHFGPRKLDAHFITKDPEQFEANMLQSLLDIHQAKRVLDSIPEVQAHNLGLMGLSLGGMVTLISAGVDPIFDRYATNVGGGDLANIVTYRKSGDVDSQTGRLLKDIDWSVDQARFMLSRFDAVTWSLNAKNKKILLINAVDDELIKKETSLEPMVEGFRMAGSKVQTIVHKGTHVFRFKEVGIKETLFKVMLPMMNFMGQDAPINYMSCY